MPQAKIALPVRKSEFNMASDDPATSDWCSLSWTRWQPLEAEFVRAPRLFRLAFIVFNREVFLNV